MDVFEAVRNVLAGEAVQIIAGSCENDPIGLRPRSKRDAIIGSGRHMAANQIEIRMAKLEGAYEQINERLSEVRSEILSLRAEMRTAIDELRDAVRSELRAEVGSVRTELRAEVGSLRSEVGSVRSEVKTATSDLRRQMNAQFYWLLTFILASLLVPILRELT